MTERAGRMRQLKVETLSQQRTSCRVIEAVEFVGPTIAQRVRFEARRVMSRLPRDAMCQEETRKRSTKHIERREMIR